MMTTDRPILPSAARTWSVDWCIDRCGLAYELPLILCKRPDQLATEGGNIRDHPAPDQVGSGPEALEYASEGFLE